MRRTFAFVLLFVSALFFGGCANLNLHFGKKEPEPPKVVIAPPEEGFPDKKWKLVTHETCTAKKGIDVTRKLYAAEANEPGVALAVEQIYRNTTLIRQSRALIYGQTILAADAQVLLKNTIVEFSSQTAGDGARMETASLAALGITKEDYSGCTERWVPVEPKH
ncbi:MAG TPA: hypothetical protein VLB83_03915 [Candidatus Paceibacterota bacterium]|nr:hypothetical protein [Candidatus Paceibacterota bacterium]